MCIRDRVSAAQRDGVTLICVTLNDPNDWQDTADLFDYGFSQVTVQQIPADKAGELSLTGTGGEQSRCAVVPLSLIHI